MSSLEPQVCLFEQESACFSWIHPKASNAALLFGIYAECNNRERCFTTLIPHFVGTSAALTLSLCSLLGHRCCWSPTVFPADQESVKLQCFYKQPPKYRINSNQIVFHLQAIIIRANAEVTLLVYTANLCVCGSREDRRQSCFFNVTAF